MDDKLIAACDYLGIEPEQVLKSRVDGDELVLVVNRGILGCPKYRLPLARLVAAPPAPEEEPEVETVTPDEEEASGAEAEITTTLGDDVKIVVEEVPPETYVEEAPSEPEAPEDAPEPEATASAVKLAAELGIDLASVVGTGSGGRITKRDVEEATHHAPGDS